MGTVMCRKCGRPTVRKFGKGSKGAMRGYNFCLPCNNKRLREWRHRRRATKINETWCIEHRAPYQYMRVWKGKYEYQCEECAVSYEPDEDLDIYMPYEGEIVWKHNWTLTPIKQWASIASKEQKIAIGRWR